MANEDRLIALPSLSGDEVVLVQRGIGGTGSFVVLNTLRNAAEVSTTSGSGAATSVLTTGGSLFWTGTAPTTWAITLPTAPADGTLVTIGTATTLTTMVTVTAGGSDTLSATYASQTLTAVTSVAFVYNATNTTWYRIR